MNDFYVTLPSNVTEPAFKNNVQADFTTTLAEPIELIGDYKVALSEMIYSTKISQNIGSISFPDIFKNVFQTEYVKAIPCELNFLSNITTNNFVEELQVILDEYCTKYFDNNIDYALHKTLSEDDINLINDNHLRSKTNMKQNNKVDKKIDVFYDNNKSIIIDHEHSVNKRIYTEAGGYYYNNRWCFGCIGENELMFNSITQELNLNFIKSSKELVNNYRIIVKFNTSSNELEFSRKMLQQNDNAKLKIEWEGIISYWLFSRKSNRTYFGEKIKINGNELNFLKYACVYCDIIENQYFGNTIQPVLKMIVLDQTKNSLIKNTENLHYVNVRKSLITTINLKLLDMSGCPIQFEDDFGFVVIKLHFKKN